MGNVSGLVLNVVMPNDQANTREYDQVFFICVFLYQTIFPTEETN